MQDVDDLVSLYNVGRFGEVIARGEVLAAKHPGLSAIPSLLGAACMQLGRGEEAAGWYAKALALQPDNADEHNNHGIALSDLGRRDDAVASFKRAVSIEPGFAEAHHNLGLTLAGLGRRSEAIASLTRATTLKPDYAVAHNTLGNVLRVSGKGEEAIASYARAIKTEPRFADAYNNLGGALVDLGRLDKALECFTSAVNIEPQFAGALNNMGYTLRALQRPEDALPCFARALSLRADFVDAHNNMGMTYAELGRLEEAVACYRRALEINPGCAQALNNLGNALEDLGQRNEAIECFTRALQIAPGYADALNNLGLTLRAAQRLDEALASFARAVEIKPDFAEPHHNMGVTLADMRRPDEAIVCFTRALHLDPTHALARAQRLRQQAIICDWPAIAADKDVIAQLGLSGRAIPPFALLSLEDAPARHRIRAERFAREKFPAPPPLSAKRPASRPERLRIGYFSGDFHNHAVMFLIARMFEMHDRARFVVQAFSTGPAQDDAMRARIEAGVDVFHDVRALRDREIANLARREGIDIAVDLSGYTQRARLGAFACRAAPIQVNYLGYPGTTGAEFMDYMIADKTVIPMEQRANYSEKIIYLPHSYQVNDDSRAIADVATSRHEADIPENAFVFCSFNNSYKITTQEFDVWMSLLREIPGSILWLLKTNKWAAENLAGEARQRGVDPKRLIFAEHRSLSEHLARHRLADLFLDTFNYNAHTTASDALWAGLPVVTKQGDGFAARVAASLLAAVGLPELITQNLDAYRTLALALASDPVKLAALRAKLNAGRGAAPLFDTARTTRHIESAFEQAYALHFEGKPPVDIFVTD